MANLKHIWQGYSFMATEQLIADGYMTNLIISNDQASCNEY